MVGPGMGGPGGPGMRPEAPPRPAGASWVDDDAQPGVPGQPGMAAAPFGGPRPEPRKGGGLRVFAWIALAVVIVGAGAFALWWSGHTPAPSYTIGSCVQKSGDGAVEVSCSTPNAYKIVSKVSDHSACPDQNNPYITLTGDTPSVYCLAPAQGGTPTGGASTPAGGASPAASSS